MSREPQMERHARFAAMVTVMFILLGMGSASGAERMYLTSGTLRTRALAMGSAYSSIEGDLSSGLYNPAGFRINAARNERSFRLFFNPIGSAAAFTDYNDDDLDHREDRTLTAEEAARAIGMLFEGAVFSTSAFDVGFAFNEPVIRSDSAGAHDGHFFSVEEATRESFHSAFVNLKIASSVSLGWSGVLYQHRENGHYAYSGGYSFGVLLDPTSWMKVGFTYFQLPQDGADMRSDIENIETGTVSGGVSYYPDDHTTISLDIRNLNKESTSSMLETHAGIERIFGDRIALRAGYFRKKSTEDDVISFGAGILPLWGKLEKYRNSSRQDILSYTYIMEEGGTTRNWHLVSFLLTF
jgi:hypothetical protein